MVVGKKVSCAMFVSLLLSMFVCFRRCVNWNEQFNTLACREGGNDVGEHWHTQGELTNHFFDCRIVRLGEKRGSDKDNPASIGLPMMVQVPVQLMYG